ncbi:hypothetical protein BH23BAC4_BH23BAC4_01670 [soil metagenome]
MGFHRLGEQHTAELLGERESEQGGVLWRPRSVNLITIFGFRTPC